MRPDILSLHELTGMVRQVVSLSFAEPLWLVAELSEVSPARAGHCYLDFIERDASGRQVLARARGTIWRNVYAVLAPYFRGATGQDLAAGMKVLVEVRPTFSEQYGFSLNVSDIDPTYTLGEAARRRQEVIRQLEQDGVMQLNQELALPCPLRRVAVVSSATAAGYGDFCKQLQESGLAFELGFFAAAMQGERTEPEVIAALDRIAAEAEGWDVVVIIRGGGAVSDLAAFDGYALAANVAQFPLPVLTGIGHERDLSVVDLVAHRHFKTPTAVAAFLIERQRATLEALSELERRLRQAAAQALRQHAECLARLASRFALTSGSYVGRQQQRLDRLEARTGQAAQRRLHLAEQRLQSAALRLPLAATSLLRQHAQRLTRAESAVRMAGPERILRMGFTITLRPDGRPLMHAADAQRGEQLTTRLADGEVRSVVS